MHPTKMRKLRNFFTHTTALTPDHRNAPCDFSDNTARPELLCYLVVAELVAMARTGEWLRTDHLVESGRIWCNANGARFDWQERISLRQIAAELAPPVRETSGLTRERSLVPLFVDGWMLDYASPFVRRIQAAGEGEFNQGRPSTGRQATISAARHEIARTRNRPPARRGYGCFTRSPIRYPRSIKRSGVEQC